MGFFDYPAGEQDRSASGAHLFLEQLGEIDWQRLVGSMERRRLAPGEAVIARGEADRSLFVIASGTAEVLVPEAGGEQRARELGPGSVLGEVAFFDGMPRSSTVRAVTACEVLRLGPDAFEALAARHPELGRSLLLELGRVLATRLRRAEARED
jgi:CRP/FNR family transcriptional regulator, cyclic AMP receptor protein